MDSPPCSHAQLDKSAVNRRCRGTQAAASLERAVPTLLGLLAVPFIVHPIDNAVHSVLNKSLRPYMAGIICDGAGGRQAGLDICELAPPADGALPAAAVEKGNGRRQWQGGG